MLHINVESLPFHLTEHLKIAASTCAQCGISEEQLDQSKEKNTLKNCSACKQVFYCSRACQTENWKSHKPFCVPSKKKQGLHDGENLNPGDISRICVGCKNLVAMIDWNAKEWDKGPREGRCMKCQNPSYTRPVAPPGSKRFLLRPEETERMGIAQLKLQLERSACFQRALRKDFSIRHSSHIRLAPVDYKPNEPADLASLVPLNE